MLQKLCYKYGEQRRVQLSLIIVDTITLNQVEWNLRMGLLSTENSPVDKGLGNTGDCNTHLS